MRISKAARSLPSPRISDFRTRILQYPDAISFVSGDIAELTTEQATAAAIDFLKKRQLTYPLTDGQSFFKESVARHLNDRYGLNISDKNVFAVNGGMQGLNVSVLSIIDPGQKLIVPTPYWEPIEGVVKYFSGKCSFSDMERLPNGSFQPKTQEISDLLGEEDNSGVLLGTFHNPTASLFQQERNEAITYSAIRNGKAIILDEPYNLFTTGKVTTASTIPGVLENGTLVYSFSKILAMPGARVGALVTKNEDLLSGIAKNLISYSSYGVSVPMQVLGAAALRDESWLEERQKLYVTKREILLRAFRETGHPVLNEGTPYVFPRFKDFDGNLFEHFLKHGIGVLPGELFGKRYKDHVRLSCSALPEEKLYEAVPRIISAVKELSI